MKPLRTALTALAATGMLSGCITIHLADKPTLDDKEYFVQKAEMRTCWADSKCETEVFDLNKDGIYDTALTMGDFNMDRKPDYQIMRFNSKGQRIMWLQELGGEGKYRMLDIAPYGEVLNDP
jgi:hypothetical protein